MNQMDNTIILECQAKSSSLSCQDCILRKECHLKGKGKDGETWENDMAIYVKL
jgi:hypothetical protein